MDFRAAAGFGFPGVGKNVTRRWLIRATLQTGQINS
jgi:hypothetical protein